MPTFNTNIFGCARCGADHHAIEVQPLRNATGRFDHYASCPNTDEPILVEYDAPEIRQADQDIYLSMAKANAELGNAAVELISENNRLKAALTDAQRELAELRRGRGTIGDGDVQVYEDDGEIDVPHDGA